MLEQWRFCGLVLAVSIGCVPAHSQAATPYSLSVSVNEVNVTFHAEDSDGLPINDLKLDELRILDNGKPPARVLSFGSLRDFPIRGGILLDTSESMEAYLARNRAIANEYMQRLLRTQIDQAFVMDFDRQSHVVQPWSGDRRTLAAGIHGSSTSADHDIHGTAIFDALYRACLNQFGRLDRRDSANFVLLFSDGEDNASLTLPKDAIDMCQRTNTPVYVFRVQPEAGFSTGPKTLAEVASKTGGRVFYEDNSDASIYQDLQAIESDLRNQYRVIYKPAELRHDGSFHTIELTGPERVERFVARSGYYAPIH